MRSRSAFWRFIIFPSQDEFVYGWNIITAKIDSDKIIRKSSEYNEFIQELQDNGAPRPAICRLDKKHKYFYIKKGEIFSFNCIFAHDSPIDFRLLFLILREIMIIRNR